MLESVGDTTPVPLWLSSPVSEPALDGVAEASAVVAPESAFWLALPNPARRIIFMAGCDDWAVSMGVGAFAASELKGGGLKNLLT